jgi:hypothetical protein
MYIGTAPDKRKRSEHSSIEVVHAVREHCEKKSEAKLNLKSVLRKLSGVDCRQTCGFASATNIPKN